MFFTSSKKAFTVIEILVSITILAIMISLAFIATSKSRANARDSRRIGDINQIQAALERYATDVGAYPSLLTPGSSLINPVSGKIYLEKIPSNPAPWTDGNCVNGTDYIYTSTAGNTYTINYCLAAGGGYTGPGLKQAYPGVVMADYQCPVNCSDKVCGSDGCGGSCGSCGGGTACVADQTACLPSCSTDQQCGLCQKCVGGFCSYQTAGEDLKNECVSDSCASGLCNGSGICTVYEDNKKHSCSGCNVCRSGGVCGAASTGAVSNFVASSGAGAINLSWTYGLDFDSYHIFRRATYPSAGGGINGVNCNSTVTYNTDQNSYQDGVATPTLYFYKVCPYIAGCSATASSIVASCSRSGGSGEPTVQASALTTINSGVCNPDNTVALTFYWQPGNGQGAILTGEANNVPTDPTDGVSYNIGATYGATKVYYVGADCYVTIDGLLNNTSYDFKIDEYNNQDYFLFSDGGNLKSIRTVRCP